MRERHTGYPIIPGSSIKGVVRSHFHHSQSKEFAMLHFGYADEKHAPEGDPLAESTPKDGKSVSRAGYLAFSEARLTAFPVRSAAGSFALVTSRTALARLKRDAGLTFPLPDEPASSTCLSGAAVVIGDARDKVVLEEYVFSWQAEFPADWAEFLSSMLEDAVLKASIDRFVLLPDEDMSHFAKNATEVRQHVRINPETGTVDGSGLFNEETVPAETLFTATITETSKAVDVTPVLKEFSDETLLQFGGNNTTGLGFCTVKVSPLIHNVSE